MNPMNANADGPSRLPDSNEIKSGLAPGKPAQCSAALGRSKPRMVKSRRHSNSSHPRSAESSSLTGEIDRQGFNPFRSTISDNSIPSFSSAEMGNLKFGNAGNDEAFVFGAARPENLSPNLSFKIGNSNNYSEFVPNKILDEMRKLKIGSEQEFVSSLNNPALNLNASGSESSRLAEVSLKGVASVFEKSGIDECEASKLPDEMRKLNSEGSGNAANFDSNAHNKNRFTFGIGDNFTNVVSELPNELNKLHIKHDAGVVDGSSLNCADNMKKFVFGDTNKGGNSLPGSSAASKLADKMKNLNTRDDVNTCGGEEREVDFRSFDKSSFVFRSTLNRREENMLSNDMGKLKIPKEVRDDTVQGQASLASSPLFVKEKAGNLGDNKFQDVRSSIPAGFTFQAGLQGQSLSSIQVPPDHYNGFTKLHSMTTSFSMPSSSGVCSQPVENIMQDPSMDRSEKMDKFNFTSSWDAMGTPYVEFTTPNQKGNMFTGSDNKLEFSAKKKSTKDARSKKKRGKLRKPSGQDFVLRRNSSQEPQDSFESYSPMDVSPYQEADNKASRETSVTTEEPFHFYNNNASSKSHPTTSNDEDLVDATRRLGINDGNVKFTETKVEGSQYRFGKGDGADCPSEESFLGAETESFKSADERLDNSTDTFVIAADTEMSSSSRIEREDSNQRMQFSFASASENGGVTSFTFSASSSAQIQSSAAICHHKKKNCVKVGHKPYSSSAKTKVPHTSSSMQFFPLSETSLLASSPDPKGDISSSFSKKQDNSEPVKEQETKQKTISIPAASIAAQEACEKWRLRGNQAYSSGDMLRAEDYYTQGLNCTSQNENSRSCLRALMLCYSNRAATRMSLGRMREALADCMKAAEIDPNFLRVHVRAANCYLALGEVEDASRHFIKCLQSGSDACVDRKLVLEASEGLEKVQKVSECLKQSAELLQGRTSRDAERALGIIAEALTISSYCEKLLEMKADALFMLRKYEESIQLCEQTLGSAKMNYSTTTVYGHSTNVDCYDVQKKPSFRLWRWRLIIKSYFYLGRLEEALNFLKKQKESVSATEESESKCLESLLPLAGTISELLRHKAAGNEAFQSGRHAEAVGQYTAALSCTVESRPFAAICFCNRAAAYKAMGQITDAIADCSLAIALDGNYLKAISRRATLFEMIRDYDRATIDLQRIVSLLMKHSGASDRMTSVNELREAQKRLSLMEEEARKEIPLNMYLILGVDPSVAASEIKKAYRKAALRHHPDKAGQSLARSDGDDGIWKEVVEEVHKDADRLFKMIGEAYAVLSDPTKRLRYDQEEEMRNAQKSGKGGSASRMNTDVQNYTSERSTRRRQWRDIWRS